MRPPARKAGASFRFRKAASARRYRGARPCAGCVRPPQAGTGRQDCVRAVIVDAHIHLWEKGTPRAAHRQAPYSKDDALADMAAAGVDAAVIQPPAWDPDADRIAMEAAALHPRKFAVLASFPLQELKRQPGVLGLRYIFSQPQHAALFEQEDPWQDAQARGIPVALALGENLLRLAKVAERFPALKLLVDHLGVPV